MNPVIKKLLIVIGIMIGSTIAGLGIFLIFMFATTDEYSRASVDRSDGRSTKMIAIDRSGEISLLTTT